MGDAVDMLAMEEDLDQRIAVLRRYRRMLEMQRERLQDYLSLIDTREVAIKAGDVDSLEQYTQLEQNVIGGIMAVQKCLEPLAVLYQQAAPEGSPDIDELQARLEHLRGSILARNAQSVSLLKGQMEDLRKEIASLKVPKGSKAVYTAAAEPQLFDMLG